MEKNIRETNPKKPLETIVPPLPTGRPRGRSMATFLGCANQKFLPIENDEQANYPVFAEKNINDKKRSIEQIQVI